MYTCKKCKTVVTLEKRAHICTDGRQIIYKPAKDKDASKQAMQPGYMKRFGSTSKKHK